jgi:hypothetical protein
VLTTSRLEKIYQTTPDLIKKQEFLETFEKELHENADNPDYQLISEFKGWRANVVLQDLSNLSLNKNNAQSLANLCKDLLPEEIEERYELYPVTSCELMGWIVYSHSSTSQN